MRYLIALGAFLFLNGAAHACLFARDAKPQDWYEWANVLFAADVTNIEQQNRVDVISQRLASISPSTQPAAFRQLVAVAMPSQQNKIHGA